MIAMGPKKAAAKPAKSVAAASVKKVGKKVEAVEQIEVPEKKKAPTKVKELSAAVEEEVKKKPTKATAVAKKSVAPTPSPAPAPTKGPVDKPAPKAKITKTITINNTNTNNEASKETNIVYLGHIPTDFMEKEIRKFFTQYGKVKKVKLFKSNKPPHRSKGYAFIMFEDEDVAAVVGSSINGYLMGGKQLVCHVVPSEKVSYFYHYYFAVSNAITT